MQVAGDDAGAAMFLDFLGGAASVAAAIAAWRRATEAARRSEGVAGPSPATVHPSKPAEDKENTHPPPAVPQTSAAAPALPPEDPRQEKEPPKGRTPKKASYEIGASDGGPGQWAKVNENLTPEEAAYQQKATGAPKGTAYNVPDPEAPTGFTKFDGYEPETNTLIDAKLWNDWPIEKKFSTDSVMEQVERQLRSARGTKIVWRVPSSEKASQLEAIFQKNDISIIAIEVLNP